jgi:hypothetical protein
VSGDNGWGLVVDVVALWMILGGVVVIIWLSRTDKPGKPRKPFGRQ